MNDQLNIRMIQHSNINDILPQSSATDEMEKHFKCLTSSFVHQKTHRQTRWSPNKRSQHPHSLVKNKTVILSKWGKIRMRLDNLLVLWFEYDQIWLLTPGHVGQLFVVFAKCSIILCDRNTYFFVIMFTIGPAFIFTVWLFVTLGPWECPGTAADGLNEKQWPAVIWQTSIKTDTEHRWAEPLSNSVYSGVNSQRPERLYSPLSP